MQVTMRQTILLYWTENIFATETRIRNEGQGENRLFSINHAHDPLSLFTRKFQAKRKNIRGRLIKIFATTSFYRTILCIYSFIIQENSLALTFPPTTVRIINVALKIRYNVRIQYIYTKAHSFNKQILSVRSYSLVLFLALSLLSAAKIGTVFFAIFYSRIIVSY